jgi:Domain of unknown function (DUF4362)
MSVTYLKRTAFVLWVFICLLMLGCSSHVHPEKGDVIDMHGSVTHLEKMDEFIDSVTRNQHATLRLIRYTIEGDPIFHDLSYQNQTIEYRLDSTEDQFGKGEVATYFCDALERKETDTLLQYTLTGCTGNNGTIKLLTISFDVGKQDVFAFVLQYGENLPHGDVAEIRDDQLSNEARQLIYKKMVLSNYLGEKRLSTECNHPPHVRYYLNVQINGALREFKWAKCDQSEDGKTMTALAKDMIAIATSKEERKQAPEANSQAR